MTPNSTLQPTAGKRRLPVPSSRRSSAAAERSRWVTNMRSVLLGLILSALALTAAATEQTLVFAGGKVEVVLPASFNVTNRDDGSLLATFGPGGNHRVELTLHDHEKTVGPPDLDQQFVRAQAEKKKRRVTEGSGKSVFMDPAGDFRDGEATMRVVHWQIGFGKSLVVMTLTAPVEQPMSSALSDFLGKQLNILVGSLRRV
jgi:hypothetical protein